MKLDDLQRKLIEVARGNPPSPAVPYAFEQRILAQLRRPVRLDPMVSWTIGLWRATVPCLILLSGVALWNWNDRPASSELAYSGADPLEMAVVDAIDLSDSVDEP